MHGLKKIRSKLYMLRGYKRATQLKQSGKKKNEISKHGSARTDLQCLVAPACRRKMQDWQLVKLAAVAMLLHLSSVAIAKMTKKQRRLL